MILEYEMSVENQMKKVFLYAYDKVNLGDDLFIRTIVMRYPNVQFYLWSEKYNKTNFKDLTNLKVLDKNSIFVNFLKKLRSSLVARYKIRYERNCDAIVYIGGSLFIEYDNWKQILSWWEYEAEQYPFFVLGANFGPYKSEIYREKLESIFDKMQDVCFRDLYSYNMFKNCPKIRFAPDILFSTEMPSVRTVEKQIFVSVINCGRKEEGQNKLADFENRYIKNIAELLETYIKHGYSVILASFCRLEGDEEAVEKILSLIKEKEIRGKITALFYNGTNYQEVLMTLAESEYILASRFHAAILGIAAGKPVFPIVYSDKTIQVLKDIGFKGNYADIRIGDKIEYEFSYENLKNRLVVPIENLSKQSEAHFEILDNVLK